MAKARILIVEDEAIIAAVIAGALKKFGYEVADILYTGKGAAEVAWRENPDLILMDIRLQGDVDGITVAEQIQERADIPIIYLTAYADDPTLERAKLTKPYGYIPKPFQEIELKAAIEMALYKSQFELRLKASEARFRSLFENSQDVIYIADEAGRLLAINQAGQKLFGHAHRDMTGRPLAELYDDPEHRQRLVARMQKSGKVKDFEVRLKNKDGGVIHALETANLILDQDGRLGGFQGIIRDVTEKRRREESLLLLQTAIDSSSEAVIITDASGAVVYCNPAVEAMTGYTPLETLGRSISLFEGDDQGGRQERGLWPVLHAGKSWTGEFRSKRKDGTTYYQRAIVSPVRDDKGALRHLVSIASDITREKRLEEQMIQAAKMDSLGRLASGIAHDFNNYLTIINGHTEMMLHENEKNKDGERLNVILGAGRNASKLVAKILGFSRSQAAEPRVINVNETLKELERMLRQLLGAGIDLRLDLHPQTGHVRIDPTQIEQVMINLVLNACDAMPDGGLLVLESKSLRVDDVMAVEHPGLAAGDYAAICVRDSGSGMEPAVLARIFEPFYTTKATGEGTGLGLASVFAIVNQNNGSIWAESEPGKGSVFHLLLPRVAIAEPSS